MIRKIQANVPVINWLLESINKKQRQLLCLCVDKTHTQLCLILITRLKPCCHQHIPTMSNHYHHITWSDKGGLEAQ